MGCESQRWGSLLCGLLALLLFGQAAHAERLLCRPNQEALGALYSTQNFTVEKLDHVGYGFFFQNPGLNPIVGGPNVTRGLVILPENGVPAAAYAPYANLVALFGYYTVIINKATPGLVLEAMIQHPELTFWSLAGHGRGGELAARIAVTLQPKVKSLVLIASALPPDVDLRSINLFLTVIYGGNDNISTPGIVTSSFSRVVGDAAVTELPGFGHYDFAFSNCLGNSEAPSTEKSSVLNATYTTTIANLLIGSVEFSQWFPGTQRALSYGNNHYLTPGFNDSKPYPGNITVRSLEVPVPGTFPQRVWWVLTPSEIKGGLVFYPGAAVEGRAYFPLAFEIAARGHLVVILQYPERNGQLGFLDANAVIDSNLTVFSGVPKGRWAVAGHSLGGIGVTQYLGCYGNKIYAAVLMAGGWTFNANASEVPVLQIFGSLDDLGGGSFSYTGFYIGLYNPNTTVFVEVPGANHYQVGDYGYQSPDDIATLDLHAQHVAFANHTVSFLDALPTKTYAPILSGPACPTIS